MNYRCPTVEPTNLENLLTPDELAVHLKVRRSWVYSRAEDLGVFRLGKYLRFSWPRVLERLEAGLVSTPLVGVKQGQDIPKKFNEKANSSATPRI